MNVIFYLVNSEFCFLSSSPEIQQLRKLVETQGLQIGALVGTVRRLEARIGALEETECERKFLPESD